ncbi:flavodoxin [Rhizobium leguminosarum]|uniref:flavodoxin n=1 Tax=Rhizobium leguminosarum TaxID=384 RepID=UPI001030230D|nr:flavodoxin [Rhizobium leguminosarum]TBD03501.1 flavodoxin [Rhizobium leguminosarum]
MQKSSARRHFLTSLPLAAIGLAMTSAGTGAQQTSSANTLVAYFTRTGNTRVIALQVRRARQAALIELQPAEPYPEDYDETVAQARRETEQGFLPPLAQLVANLEQYQEIFLGFPIWGTTAPPVIRSFLRSHDLSGKIIRPFITHGGYGLGNSLDVIRSLAPSAMFEPPFSLEADQERRTMEQVRSWLG